MVRFNGMNYASIFGYGGYGGYGLTDYLYGNRSQVSGVRTGDYSRIMRSYYNRSNSSISDVLNSRYSSKTYPEVTGMSTVKTEASELVESAKKLTDTGKNSLFRDKSTYDADAAYKAVSELASNYNDTILAAERTGNSVIKSAAGSMTRMSGIMKNSLSKVGVNVEKDGRLSVNEDSFKNADMNYVSTLFGGTGSYTNMIVSSASRIRTVVDHQNLRDAYSIGTYGRYGMYNNYYSGGWFNGFF